MSVIDKRGVVLKKRGMPLVPWSERTLEVSGATLCYEYPTHDMRRTYTLGSSWRCVAGSGDTFRLLAVDSQGRGEEMTLRPFSRSKAERDAWVRVISSGIRIAVEESMRRRAAAAAQDRLADDGAWPDAMPPVSPRVPRRPQFRAMSTPRVVGGEHICNATTGTPPVLIAPTALAAAAVDSDAAGAAAAQLRSLREQLAGAQHTGAEAQQRVDELRLELAQQEEEHAQLKAVSAAAAATDATGEAHERVLCHAVDAAHMVAAEQREAALQQQEAKWATALRAAKAEHEEWKRRCEVAEAACADLEANMASLRADVEQGCAERAALAAERAALAVELAQLHEAKAVSEKELRARMSNTAAVTAAAASEAREEQARESRAAAAAEQRLRADLEAAEQKHQVRVTAAAAVSASRIAELEAKVVALEAKDSAPEDDLPEDEANLRSRLRGATALLDAAVSERSRALEQMRECRRFQRQTLVDATQMAVPAQCLSAMADAAARYPCPMPTGVHKTAAGWQVRVKLDVLGIFSSKQAAVRAFDEAYARVITQSGLRDQREAQGRLVRLQLPTRGGGLVGMDLSSTTKPPFYVWVKSIAEGSRAQQRVQVGDLLVAINGECCQGQQITKVVSRLQGVAGQAAALDLTFVRSAAACQPAEDKRGSTTEQLPWMQNLTNIRRNLTSRERHERATARLLQQIELETKAVSAMSQQLKKRGHRAVAPSSAKKQQRRPMRL